MSETLEFTCDGRPVSVQLAPGETLLTVLRERLGARSVKDGCAPQGQCGCCTVLVDGDPRVACVTPATRVAGRTVTTLDGLDATVRDAFAQAFVATGGSQCGFCTPGIIVRCAAAVAKGRAGPAEVDRALAAHLCRCTGWQTIRDAVARVVDGDERAGAGARDLDHATARATLEGGVAQRVSVDTALGRGGFADDMVPPGRGLVAIPLPPGSGADSVEAEGLRWVVAESLHEARARAGKVQGRRTTIEERPPLALPDAWPGGVRLATSWVEPAYLEPDASSCEPGCEPLSPLANGGAFGGKTHSVAPAAARALAERFGRPVRVLFSREDVVRIGPKRPPIAARARYVDGTIEIDGVVARGGIDAFRGLHVPYPAPLPLRASWRDVDVAGPRVAPHLRASGLAETAVLAAGALDEAGADVSAIAGDGRGALVALDTVVSTAAGGLAGARVFLDREGTAIDAVTVRVAAGDVLDETALRSYVIGAAHMALGWVLSEAIAVDPETGDVRDLTIRSFGILRAREMPHVDVEIVDDAGPPVAVSDAAFAAVAAATWNAMTRAGGSRPETFPARTTRLGTRSPR